MAAKQVTTSVKDLFHGSDAVDNSEVFSKLWGNLSQLHDRIQERFDLTQDPSSVPYDFYETGTGAIGELHTYTGPEMDWLVHSYLGDPEKGFTNMHLTGWLGPQTKVPHLGIAWGTLPELWFYVDLQPRSDLMVDTDSLDRYFEPFNERYLAYREHEVMKPFVSRSLYMRQSVTHIGLAFVIPTSDEMIDEMMQLTSDTVHQWLAWVDEGDPVAPEEQAVLAARDLHVRRTVAERDPANVLGVEFYGAEFTEKLVRMLWGGDRVLPRPGIAQS